MHIEIFYANEEEALYGIEGSAGYDERRSEEKYQDMLYDALQIAYPDADITVKPGGGQIRVDGLAGDDEAIYIMDIVHTVWSSFDWLVKMPANGKARSQQIQAAAAAMVSGLDVTGPVELRPLAKALVEEVGCEYSTAKRHLAKAVRRARGKMVKEGQWGGPRPGSGRPRGE